MVDFVDPYEGKDVRPHPAKFSDSIIETIRYIIPDNINCIVDPMAGIGKITQLGNKYRYILNELEPEWANQIDPIHEVHIGDAKDMEIPSEVNCAVITSPPYGNRMADFFISKTKPQSMKGRYAGDLGRKLSDGSTASKRYGNVYKSMMTDIYTNISRQMVRDQYFILNVSNFISNYLEVNVIGFYLELFSKLGFTLDLLEPVVTPRDRSRGANSDLRVKHEVVMLWRKITND